MHHQLFQCSQGDFEGQLSGAMNHCGLTGHTLSRQKADGTVMTIELEPEDDDPYGGGGDE